MAEAPGPTEPTAAQAAETMRSRPFVGLLVVAAVIGVIVSLAAWCYLESVYQLQQELFKHLPHALGYDQGPPLWWSLPVLAVGALIVALAITRLPGDGGHVPAKGSRHGRAHEPDRSARRDPRGPRRARASGSCLAPRGRYWRSVRVWRCWRFA